MNNSIKIDFVSDVSCPWCVIGLKSLEAALANLAGQVEADIHFQPFELNPQMSAEGEDIAEHIARKYGSGASSSHRPRRRFAPAVQIWASSFASASAPGSTTPLMRIACCTGPTGTGKQKALKEALFTAYFADGRDPSDHRVLRRWPPRRGLDADRARQILTSDEYADEVRAREQWYLNQGIHAVPAVILNDRYLIQGGQPVEAFERALRQVADEITHPPPD